MRFVLLALLDRAIVPIQVLQRGKTLHALSDQIAVGASDGGQPRPFFRHLSKSVSPSGFLTFAASVRTAQTEMTGFFDGIMVENGLITGNRRLKPEPGRPGASRTHGKHRCTKKRPD